MHFNKLDFTMPSDVYHGEGNSFSSSQLKTMLQDPELFYRKYITKEFPKEENQAFDVGTYFHTAILESEKLAEECIVFPGDFRRGKAWEDFKELHKGKAILTKSNVAQADALIKAVNESEIAKKILEGGSVEVSAFLDIFVFDKQIYTFFPDESLYKLSANGWQKVEGESGSVIEFSTKLRLKVRADSINLEAGYISDLKSTTGNCKDAHAIKEKVASYEYDLSASLYLDIFTATTGKLFKDFYWIFASKDIGNSKTWVASEKQKIAGRYKWKRAAVMLAEYIDSNWTFKEEIGVCEPTFYNNALLSEEF